LYNVRTPAPPEPLEELEVKMKLKVISITAVLGFYVFLLLVWVLNHTMHLMAEGTQINGWQSFALLIDMWGIIIGFMFLTYFTIKWLLK